MLCFWLNQWKLRVSMVHIDDWRAVWDMSHLFPPDSGVSGADMKGTAALGHSGTVRYGAVILGRHTASLSAYLWSHPR